MFSNVGRKIKIAAKFFCWIGIIGSVVYGFVLIAQGNNMNNYSTYVGGYRISGENTGNGLVLAGVLIIFLGSLFSWLGSLGIYALGQITMNSDITAETAVEIKELLEKERNSAEDGMSEEETEEEKKRAHAIPVSEEVERCEYCGTTQRKDRDKCYKCGAWLIRDTDEEKEKSDPAVAMQEEEVNPEPEIEEQQAEHQDLTNDTGIEQGRQTDSEQTEEPEEKEAEVISFMVNDEKKKCAKCGTVQRAGRVVCFKCGTRFPDQTEQE